MAAAEVTPAILEYLEHGAHPDSESVSTAELSPDALASLLNSLQNAQNEAKSEIRTLSKTTASDIDPWISRAKELQADIVRARETARQVVAEADEGRELRNKAHDARAKASMLEKEVAFNQSLAGTLEKIRHANGLLNHVQELAVQANVEGALEKLDEAQSSIAALNGMGSSRAHGLLRQRADQLRQNMAETTTEWWNRLIDVGQESKKVTVTKPDAGKIIGIESVVAAAQGLGILQSLLQKLSKELERAIFKPRLLADASGKVAKVSVSAGELSCSSQMDDTTYETLFADLKQIFDFLATRLPSQLVVPLSEILIPAVTARLEEHWLGPAVPIEVEDLHSFQFTLDNVLGLAQQIEVYSWHGSKELRDWVQGAPRIWLTKRREAILGDVRNLVFAGLRERKVVERVETRMVSDSDTLNVAPQDDPSNGGDVDDWNDWGDQEEEEPSTVEPEQSNAAEDEADEFAWGSDDDEDGKSADKDGADEEEEDGWGWGDEDQKPKSPVQSKSSVKPKSPVKKRVAPAKPNGGGSKVQQPAPVPTQREITLRETFTVTGVCDGVLSIVKSIIASAETLAGPDFASSPIAPAATALYTLPTLALAIYRATAPTAYTKLDTGNMLIYNDASQLASQLRDWQAEQPPASRLRLDNDVKALDTFAKRAYSSEMESQRTILRDLLDGAQGFSNATVQPYKTECESSIDQTVHRLRDVHKQWKDVLSQGALLQSLGSLLATVTGKMINEVEDLGDIGEEDSHQLTSLCHRVSEVKDMFLQQQPLGDGATEAAEPADMTFIYCPNWLKFQYLAEILESSLADIKYLWQQGELSLEFDAEEVVELINALFADSDLRKRAIVDIRRGGRA